MLMPAVICLILACVGIFFVVISTRFLPRTFVRYFAYAILFGSTIELILLMWILGYVSISEWSLMDLSFNDFWREQLAGIYFIKQWLYTWFWNDLLNFLFSYLPAVVYLGVRTTVSSILGYWMLTQVRE